MITPNQRHRLSGPMRSCPQSGLPSITVQISPDSWLSTVNLAVLLEPLQEERVSIPIRGEADRALVGSNSRPRLRTEPAIGFPNRKAACTQQRLQFLALTHRQCPVVSRPGLDERRATAQPVRKVPY